MRLRLDVHRLQLLRRCVQIGALLLFVLVPIGARYHNYLISRELDRVLEKWDGSVQGETLAALDGFQRALPGGERERAGTMARDRDRILERAQVLRGGPWSMQAGPVSLTDPLAGAESLAASRTSSRALWLGVWIPVLIALLLGRVFCSWVCPMNLLLEFTDKLRTLFRFLELRPRDIRVHRSTKYLVLAGGLLLSLILSVPILGYLYPPAILGREIHSFVNGMFDHAELVAPGWWFGGIGAASLLILAVVLIEVTISRRWWCRYVCPGGALYVALGSKRLVRVRLVADKCTGCAQCVPVCQMGLNPMRDDMGSECDNCGLCISHCPDALEYAGAWKKREVGS